MFMLNLLNDNALIASGALRRRASVRARHDLLQVSKELLPPIFGAPVSLLLIRPEARLLHAQMGSGIRRRESPGHDTLEAHRIPRVGQRLVRLDRQHLAVNGAPVAAKIETVIHHGLEVVLHQPLLDEMWLGQRAPDLFRRAGYLAFDNDRERFARGLVHWSILLRRSSR